MARPCRHEHGFFWTSRIYGGNGCNMLGKCTDCGAVFSNEELSFCYDLYRSKILIPGWSWDHNL